MGVPLWERMGKIRGDTVALVARRGDGIRRRGESWEARVWVAGERRTGTFRSHRAAVEWRAAQIAGGDEMTITPASSITLGEWWTRYRAGWSLRPSSAARSQSAWGVHLQPRWGDTPLNEIQPSDVAAWARQLLDSGMARASVMRIVGVGGAAMTAARRAGEVSGVNPFTDVHLPAVIDPERRFVTVEEARLIETEVDPWWSLLIPFTLDTGLRISELAGLQASDVIWRDGGCVIRVQRIVTDTAGTVRIGPPKTRAGIRIVPTITRSVSRRLQDHIAERQLAPTAPLFAGTHGGVMRPTNWRARVFRPAVRAAGLAGVTPHSLRHGAVARWIAAGQSDPYVLSRWLGHSSPAIVYHTYAHLLPQDATGITARMEAEAAAARGMEDWESPVPDDRL